MESNVGFDDFLFLMDQNVASRSDMSVFPKGVETSSVFISDVSTLENTTSVPDSQTGCKRRLTNQQNEATSKRKYKKFQHLPEDIAEFKRQKVNKMERDRQGTLTQDIRSLQPFLLKNLYIPDHDADSKYTILKSSVYTIKTLYREISTLRDILGPDDQVNFSDSRHHRYRAHEPAIGLNPIVSNAQEVTNTVQLPGKVKPSLNMNETTRILPTSVSPMDVKDLEIKPPTTEHSGIHQDWIEPTSYFIKSDVTLGKEFVKTLQNCASINLPVSVEGGVRNEPVKISLFNKVFSAPNNVVTESPFSITAIKAVNSAWDESFKKTYDVPFETVNGIHNGAYSAPDNGVHNGAYSAPDYGVQNGAYSAPVNGIHDGAYSAPVNGIHNGTYSTPVNGIHDGVYGVQVNGIHDGAYSAQVNGIHDGAYSAQVNGIHNGAYSAPVNGIHDGAYSAPVNGIHDGAYSAPVNGIHIGAYSASVNGIHDGAYSAPVKGIQNGTYVAVMNGLNNGAYSKNGAIYESMHGFSNPPICGSYNVRMNTHAELSIDTFHNIEAPETEDSSTSTTKKSESDLDHFFSGPGLSTATPKPSEETPRSSGALFDDDSYVPSFFDFVN